MIYGFISAKFDSGVIVKLLREDGSLLEAFEVNRLDKVKELAGKWAKRYGVNFEWLDRPWSDDEFLKAKRRYENAWNCDFNGRANVN